ncbi:MAG: LysR family transcriptional regulator [Notoacmeibacter sp.]|nr:LysR family transcriptional regulator [Notoacmeibacter sp.]
MIDKLELFMALARERHFGRAAAACNISQPTLSSAIKQLEEQLGVQLVRRGARFHGLSPEGERVLDWARRIVADWRTMTAEMRAAHQGLAGTATIAAIPTALSMVQELTASVSASHPGVTFTVLSRSSVQIISMVDNLEADIGITYLDNEPLSAVTPVPLYTEHYRFICAPGMADAPQGTISWADAARYPLCLLTPDMQNRRIINRFLSESGAMPSPVIETDSVIAMMAHIRSGRCAGILPEKLAAFFAGTAPLVTLPLGEPQGYFRVGVIAKRQDPHTPLVETLLRHAGRLASRMQE